LLNLEPFITVPPLRKVHIPQKRTENEAENEAGQVIENTGSLKTNRKRAEDPYFALLPARQSAG